MDGRVVSICISDKKGTKKQEVSSAQLKADWGIQGDAHAGNWERQVSLLSLEDIRQMKELLPELKPGDFAENIITEGVDLQSIRIGDRIRLGKNIVLEVRQIGKECHTECQIKKLTGKCIMPTRGVFAKVLRGGRIKRNFPLRVQK